MLYFFGKTVSHVTVCSSVRAYRYFFLNFRLCVPVWWALVTGARMVCIGLAKLKDVVTLMRVFGRTDVVFLPVANAA